MNQPGNVKQTSNKLPNVNIITALIFKHLGLVFFFICSWQFRPGGPSRLRPPGLLAIANLWKLYKNKYINTVFKKLIGNKTSGEPTLAILIIHHFLLFVRRRFSSFSSVEVPGDLVQEGTHGTVAQWWIHRRGSSRGCWSPPFFSKTKLPQHGSKLPKYRYSTFKLY